MKMLCWLFAGAVIAMLLSTNGQQFGSSVQRPSVNTILPGRYTRDQIINVELRENHSGEISQFGVLALRAPDHTRRTDGSELENIARNIAWMQFQSKTAVDLGPGDGDRALWFAFRTSDGRVFWQRSRIIVDTTAPEIVIQNPTQKVVTAPTIHLSGFVKDEIRALAVTLENSAGVISDQRVSITNRRHGGRGESPQTDFECVDVHLQNGLNRLTFTATDLVGNTAKETMEFLLDIGKDIDAPQITVHWPKTLDEVNSKTLRVRGHVNEPDAVVSIVDATEEPIDVLVGRRGDFWAYDVPVREGLNTFRIVAVDPAGNSSEEAITVIKSAVEIAFDPISEKEKSKKRVIVSGTITHDGYTVWVNGVKASMNSGRWSALNVPVIEMGGTVIMQAVAIPNTVNGGNGYAGGRLPTVEDSGNPRRYPESRGSE